MSRGSRCHGEANSVETARDGCSAGSAFDCHLGHAFVGSLVHLNPKVFIL